jgi:N6-adenosine-specific RNA methylase IME4
MPSGKRSGGGRKAQETARPDVERDRYGVRDRHLRQRAVTPLPPGPYACILADPPWHFRARTALQGWTSGRGPEKHYPVIGVDDIAAIPVRKIAAKDAHLFLWITGPLLVEGKHIPIMRAWGFEPSSFAFTWVKLKRSYRATQLRFLPLADADLHVGLGLTTRKNAEFCLLGRRGNARRLAKNVREIILAPVREHSRKPDEQYERIAAYCDGPRIELFARHRWPGWDAWGNEVGKFEEAA